MIWTLWRQHRAELLIVGVALAVLAATLLVTGFEMRATYQSLGVGPCLTHPENNINCEQVIDSFRSQFDWLERASGWLNIVPALIAMLVGAPLVARELERRTYLLAWTQGVTRRRWLVAKLAAIMGAALLIGLALTTLMTWWRAPLDTFDGRLAPGGFDLEGVIPLAYMAYAMAMAIAAGALLRRAIPAMVVTLVGFVGVRFPLIVWARPYLYEPPLSMNVDPLSSAGPTRGDWSEVFGFVDHTGRSLSDQQVFTTCSSAGGATGKLNFLQCVQSHGWLVTYVYQPADRFWRFQFTEAAIYLVLIVALLALTYYLVQRRIR